MTNDGEEGDFGQVPGTRLWYKANMELANARNEERQLIKQNESDGIVDYAIFREIMDRLVRIERQLDILVREATKPVILPVAATNEPKK